MKMRFFSIPCLLLSTLVSCRTEPQGQIMLSLQTDMSLPKDVDRIRIEVTYVDSGRDAYQADFDRFEGEDSIRLPATVGFLAPEDPARAIRVRVIASRGSEESVRVLRELVTTVPVDRTAILRVPVEFLCDGSAQVVRDENGKVKRDASGRVIVESTCPEGMTCRAGRCAAKEIAPETLPDYDEADVFGGGTGKGDGTCFDTVRCFEGATDLGLDLVAFAADPTKCFGTLEGGNPAGVNVGLRTQGGGMCGANGCFVALDFESDGGWKVTEGNEIELPVAVCEKARAGQIAGAVAAPASTTPCAQKRASIPTCGPWSSSGKYSPPDEMAPIAIATGQLNPLTLELSTGEVYWTSQGSLDVDGTSMGDGAVKMVSKAGGEPTVIAEQQKAPTGLSVDNSTFFVLWANAQGSAGGDVRWAPLGEPLMPSSGHVLVEGLLQPSGIGVLDSSIYFTDIASGDVYHAVTEVKDNNLRILSGMMPQALANVDPPGVSPRNVAVAKNIQCWTYEGKLMESNGVVACKGQGATFAVADKQSTPRAIVFDDSVSPTAVYWANFAKSTEGGGIMRVDLAGEGQSMPVVIAQVDYPAGLTVDPETTSLYFTSRSGGNVQRVAFAGGTPEALVTGRKNPGAVALDATHVYWIDEGEPNTPTGAILKALK